MKLSLVILKMDDLSLTLYDLTLNSINAKAKSIEITWIENRTDNVLSFEIKDDGCGIPKDLIKQVSDPFYTTRLTRKVGLGIPFLKQLTEAAEGTFDLQSIENKGTTLKATFKLDHVDLPPEGDLSETIYLLMAHQNDVAIIFHHIYDGKHMTIDKKEIISAVEGLSLTDYKIYKAIKSYLDETIRNNKGE